jgi:hypothetical protein
MKNKKLNHFCKQSITYYFILENDFVYQELKRILKAIRNIILLLKCSKYKMEYDSG